MMYNKLLKTILSKSDALINSEEYKERNRKGNSFTRNRILTFTTVIYLIGSALRTSLSHEIYNFVDSNPSLKLVKVSKQAFSKARQNISFEGFKELCTLFVNTFYSKNLNLKKWYGYNVLAVDGTSLQIGDTEENYEHFGSHKNQYTTKTALATASALYDVLNDVVIDSIICKYKTSERSLAKQHIENFKIPQLSNNTIITLDRGYPSYEIFDFLERNGFLFLIRVSKTYLLTKDVSIDDKIVEYTYQKTSRKIRVIKVVLKDGTEEILVTNVFNKKITPFLFKELYFLRWGIECKFKELKSIIQIEEFSGTKPIVIKQDFYVSIYISLLASLIKEKADLIISTEYNKSTNKYKYQANRSSILRDLLKKIIQLLSKPKLRNKVLKSIVDKSIKTRSQIRPNRSNERKTKHSRKKHHHNSKSYI